MNNFKLIVVVLAFVLPFYQSAMGQKSRPQKTYTSKSAIDSILKNSGNILKLKKGDAEPLVTEDGQMHIYSKLKDLDPEKIGRIRIYNSLKGTGYESFGKGANQKLIYLTSSLKMFEEEYEEMTGSPFPDIVIPGPGEVAESATVPEKNKIYPAFSTNPQPQFPGGPDRFIEFIKANMVYPAVAAEANVQGKVYLEFVVEADGSITNIKTVRKVGGGTDEEAIRLLKLSQKWIPGSVAGKPVRTSYVIDIKFMLQ
ncbi:energy transducer TonB [Pedobacter caeni]|uniref:TonB family C-terminal domain-containing protein n=1 Tax=Pedobacter caeni TaxID=288992 RepID=A0A1M4V9F2_9SPHI|nr:energy transducer TonB [Pedobacter caeni]SHE65478.1 TonB family C-terminal domain-containing protein [Pedobacter caeni]